MVGKKLEVEALAALLEQEMHEKTLQQSLSGVQNRGQKLDEVSIHGL